MRVRRLGLVGSAWPLFERETATLENQRPSSEKVRCSIEGSPIRSNCKTVHFLRHGEGEHNAQYKEMLESGSCKEGDCSPYETDAWTDARLTIDGHQQALAHSTTLSQAEPPVDLVLTSSLTRTIQTTIAACRLVGQWQ